MKTLDKVIKYATPILLIMVLFRTCGVGADVKRVKENVNTIQQSMVTDTQLKTNLSDFMWRFLELEEMSDKNNIPINKLKNERKENLSID